MLADIMPYGQGSNSEKYIKTLKTLQKRFTEVRPHKNVADTLLQNGHTHKFQKNKKQSQKLKGQFFSHPPHSPNLARSDLFGGLRDAMRGHRFGRDDDVTKEVQ